MSTHDVPGMNPQNSDDLHAGCWAEHKDGSLIYVMGTENQKVLFSMFDLSGPKPVEYRDAMPLKAFEKKFSYDQTNPLSIEFKWHDKTEFPWSRVMKNFRSGVKPVSAEALIEDANEVKRSRRKHIGTKTGRVSGKTKHKSGTPKQATASKRIGLANLVEDSPRNEHLKRESKRKKVYTGVVPEEIEDAIDAIDELKGPETVARSIARSRALTPSEIEHADVAQRVDREVPKGNIAERMRKGIQSAINKLIPGRGG